MSDVQTPTSVEASVDKSNATVKVKMDALERIIRKLEMQRELTTAESSSPSSSSSSEHSKSPNLSDSPKDLHLDVTSTSSDEDTLEITDEEEVHKILALITAQFGTSHHRRSRIARVNKKSEPYCCTNCMCTYSTAWRRDPDGNRVCNPCGVYIKKHKVNRPTELHNKPLQKRARGVGKSIETIKPQSP